MSVGLQTEETESLALLGEALSSAEVGQIVEARLATFCDELLERLSSLSRARDGAAEAPAPAASSALVPFAPAADNWARVVGRQARRKSADPASVPVSQSSLPPPRRARVVPGNDAGSRRVVQSSTSRPSASECRRSAKLSALGRVPPRAAVSLSVGTGGAGVIPSALFAEARRTFDVRELGIEKVRPRMGISGALLLEIPGPDGAGKADALATKLRELFARRPGVRVGRPVKHAVVRVRSLPATLTSEEVRSLAETGKCSADEIRIGEVRPTLSGFGTV